MKRMQVVRRTSQSLPTVEGAEVRLRRGAIAPAPRGAVP